jgi:ribosomal-protein-alanine N-acetyltransferase
MSRTEAPITLDDVPELTGLDAVCFPPHVAYDADYFRELVGTPGVLGVRARDGAELAGFILWSRWPEKIGHVITVDVAPGRRREGLGTRLMTVMEEDCRAAGSRRVILEVSVTNTAAVDFYRRLGYHVASFLPDYYGEGQHAHFMMKLL